MANKKYFVEFRRTFVGDVEVTAESQEEAEKRFLRGEWDDHYTPLEIESQTILRVKESAEVEAEAQQEKNDRGPRYE